MPGCHNVSGVQPGPPAPLPDYAPKMPQAAPLHQRWQCEQFQTWNWVRLELPCWGVGMGGVGQTVLIFLCFWSSSFFHQACSIHSITCAITSSWEYGVCIWGVHMGCVHADLLSEIWQTDHCMDHVSSLFPGGSSVDGPTNVWLDGDGPA